MKLWLADSSSTYIWSSFSLIAIGPFEVIRWTCIFLFNFVVFFFTKIRFQSPASSTLMTLLHSTICRYAVLCDTTHKGYFLAFNYQVPLKLKKKKRKILKFNIVSTGQWKNDKFAKILEMAIRTVKRSEILDSGVQVGYIWGYLTLLFSRSFWSHLATLQFSQKYNFQIAGSATLMILLQTNLLYVFPCPYKSNFLEFWN